MSDPADEVGDEEPTRGVIVPGEGVRDERPDERAEPDRPDEPGEARRRQLEPALGKDDEHRAGRADREGRQ